MNLRVIIFCLTSLLTVACASKNAKNPLLKMVIDNLPKGCEEMHRNGMFNSLTPSSYECMFESDDEDENYKKAAKILVLLTQSGQKKLVEEIARMWVKKSNWGPFNQEEIAAQLGYVVSVRKESFVVKKSKKEKNEEATHLVEDKSIYEAFKVLMENGKGLIVPGPAYTILLTKIMRLTAKIDESAMDRSATIKNVLFYFLSIDKSTLEEMSETKGLASVHSATLQLNELANLGEKHGIPSATWDLFAPLICAELNKQYPNVFSVIETVDSKGTKENANNSKKNIEVSSKFVTDKTESILKDLTKVSLSKKKTAPISGNSNLTTSGVTPYQSNELIGLWMVIAGLGILLVVALFGIFYSRFTSKRSDLEDL